MKRKLIWLNLLLAGLITAAGLRIHDEWAAGQKQVGALSSKKIGAPPVASVAIPPPPPAVVAASYSDIASRMLFSKDRNPTVVVEVAVAPPPKPMPALPILHGVMGLPSGMLALMSANVKAPSNGIKVGEKIGEFELAALTQDEISLKWEDKTVTRSVSEMIYSGQEQQSAEKAPASAAAASASAAVAPPPVAPAVAGKPGTDVVGSVNNSKTCTPGDTSPNGTVADGFRKVIVATPFGPSCHWEQVK